MPNPVPRPFALNVYVSTPPSGFNYNISAMINKRANPVIRFSADGLSSETSLPLHYTGSLPYSIQEWAEIKIEAIDNSEKLFRGYIGRLTSNRLGAERYLTLSCVDGNIKLKRGVGRTVDAGTPGIIPTLLTYPAGTTDREVIIDIFDAYLPDVDWSLVDNVFTLAEPFSVGYCSVYDALIELRKRAPALAKIRFYCGFRQADWAWQFRWFDMVTIPTSGITLLEDPEPGAGEANYWTFQRVRDGIPIFNRWYVVGQDPVAELPIIGSADDTSSQGDLTVIIAGISENTELGTVADCNAEAARILTGKSRARESFTGIETHQPLLLTGPQAVYIKNDLEPGITTPQPFPISGVEFSFPNMIPTYRADLGDRWLALGEEEEGRLYSTAPTRDLTPPDAPTWPGGLVWVVSNEYEPSSNTAMLHITWNANTEGDLRHYRLHWRRYAGDELGSPLPWSRPIIIERPTNEHTLEFPAGVLVGFMLEAEDTAGNRSAESAVVTTTTANDPIPKPTALTITEYGIHHAGNTDVGAPAESMYVKLDFDLGSYVPGEGAVYRVLAVQTAPSSPNPHRVHGDYLISDTTLPLYFSGLRLGGITYDITVWVKNRYNLSGPPSDPEDFTTKRIYPAPNVLPWAATKDDRGLVPGYDNITTTGSASWGVLEDEGDQGGNAFVGSIENASEKITLTQRPFGITKGRPLSWAFSVRAHTVADAPATGTFKFIIKWCSADLTVLNTQTVKEVVPPTISTYSQYEGKVDPYTGAVVAIVEMEYGGTSVAETVYIGLVQLSDQQKAFNMSTRAVLPTAINLLVPGVLQNGSMEQPNLTGTLPEGYEATGTYVYNTDAGTADGYYALRLGGTTATHTFTTPFIFWTYPIRPSLNYGLRVKWSQYFVNTVGPTREVRALFYDSNFAALSPSALLKANDATTNYTVPVAPNPGECEALVPGSIIPANTAYIRLEFKFITTNSAQLWTVDSIETAPAAMALTANSLQFRSLGGALQLPMTAGPTLPTPLQIEHLHWYSGAGKRAWVFWNGTYWLGTERDKVMHQHDAGPAPYGPAVSPSLNILVLPVNKIRSIWFESLTVSFLSYPPHNAVDNWTFNLMLVGGSVGGLAAINSINSYANLAGHSVWDAILDTSFSSNPVLPTDTMMYLQIVPNGAVDRVFIVIGAEYRLIYT